MGKNRQVNQNYYKKNKEKIIKRNVEYVKKNFDKTKQYQKNYKSKWYPMNKKDQNRKSRIRMQQYLKAWDLWRILIDIYNIKEYERTHPNFE